MEITNKNKPLGNISGKGDGATSGTDRTRAERSVR
jgi:hypothetical protein